VVQAVAEAVGFGEGASNAPGSGLVLDLYCGTGTTALCLALRLKAVQVVGFDVSASSIADAEANAARNGLSNVRFVRGDLNQLLPDRPAAKSLGLLWIAAQQPRKRVWLYLLVIVVLVGLKHSIVDHTCKFPGWCELMCVL
jgi:SAM-dependent methyltransferase